MTEKIDSARLLRELGDEAWRAIDRSMQAGGTIEDVIVASVLVHVAISAERRFGNWSPKIRDIELTYLYGLALRLQEVDDGDIAFARSQPTRSAVQGLLAMTDTEIDKQVAALQATIEWLRGQKRVPDAPPVAPLDPGPPGLELSDLIEAGDAAALVRKAKSTVASWCRSNAISGADGFAVKVGGRWLVSKSRLLKHLASVSRD